MKTKSTSTFAAAFLLLATVCAFTTMAQAASVLPVKATSSASTPKVTTETSEIAPATEQIVVTEKYRDGTVIRVVQILRPDGSSETSGERRSSGTKS